MWILRNFCGIVEIRAFPYCFEAEISGIIYVHSHARRIGFLLISEENNKEYDKNRRSRIPGPTRPFLHFTEENKAEKRGYARMSRKWLQMSISAQIVKKRLRIL